MLLGILHTAVPVGAEHKLVFLAELHVQIRITGIHAGTYAIVHLVVFAAGHRVLVRKLPHAAESQERAEAQCRLRMRIKQRITDKDAVLVMLEHNLLLQQHPSDSVDRGWHFIAVELTDVLMPCRTVVVALILMEAEVELCAVLHHRGIQR